MEDYSKFIQLTNHSGGYEVVNVDHIVRITSDKHGFAIVTTDGKVQPKETLEEVIAMLPSCIKLSDIN